MVIRQTVEKEEEEEEGEFECGHRVQKQFQFDPSYTNLNHGSFGTAPKPVIATQHHYQSLAEAKPDIFIRYNHPRLLDESRSALASYIDAPASSCVLVPNATTGINTVLRNLNFSPGDVIIYFSTIYGSCEKTLLYLTEITPVTLHRIEDVHPLSHADILSLFKSAIKSIQSSGQKPRLAIFDTISSQPALLFPYKELSRICRENNILSLIDGAHGVGQIPLSLSILDPDFFVSNLHKWLYVPRSCALLYVAERNQRAMRSTLPTSHGFMPKDDGTGTVVLNPLPASDKGDFVNNFEFVGTLDSSAYLTVAAALEWRGKVTWQGARGEDAVTGYMYAQAREAGRLLAVMFGTETLDYGGCGLSNVDLPLDFLEHAQGDMKRAVKIGVWISDELIRRHDTFMAIIFHGKKWFVRLSAQIYLTMDDWNMGGEALKSLCEEVRSGKWEESKDVE